MPEQEYQTSKPFIRNGTGGRASKRNKVERHVGFRRSGRLGNLLDHGDKEYGKKKSRYKKEEHITAQPVRAKGVSRRDQTLRENG